MPYIAIYLAAINLLAVILPIHDPMWVRNLLNRQFSLHTAKVFLRNACNWLCFLV